MAKDIKLYKGDSEIIINEVNLDYYKKLGYTEEQNKNKNKSTIKDKQWQHITEKKA